MGAERESPGPGTPGPPGDDSAPPPKKKTRRRRLWRVLKWVLVTLFGLITLLVIAVWLILANLNHPAVKSRVISLVKTHAGLTIDYDDLEVSVWSGASARSLSVASPPLFADHAADFVHVRDFKLDASLWRMGLGNLSVDRLHVGRVDVALAVDAQGRTTLTELFPPSEKKKDDKKKDEPTPLSHLLGSFPALKAKSIHVGEIHARLIEIDSDGAVAQSTVSALSIDGAVSIGKEGLAGTEIAIGGAESLIVEGGARGRAEATVSVRVIGASASSVTLKADIDLKTQSLIETTSPIGKLLALEATVEFDKPGKQVIATVRTLDSLDGRLHLDARAVIPDGESFELQASANAKADFDELPIVLDGVSVGAASFGATATKLSLRDGVLAGEANFTLGVGSARVDRPTEEATLSMLLVSGNGRFDGPVGNAEVRLQLANASAASGPSSADIAMLSADLTAFLERSGDDQNALATLSLSADDLNATGEAGAKAKATKLALTAGVGGTVAELIAGAVRKATATLRVNTLEAADGAGSRADITALRSELVATGVSADPLSESGFVGDATVRATLGSLKGRSGTTPVRVAELSTEVSAPLSLASAKGVIALASASSKAESARGLNLTFAVESPLQLAPGSPGTASATIEGSASQLRSADSRGRLPTLRLALNRAPGDRFKVELDAKGSSLRVIGKPITGTVATRLRADASLAAPRVDLTLDVRGSGGAKADARLNARFDRRSSKLVYAATVSASELDAFSPVLAAATEDANVKLKEARLDASAEGELSGLLRARGREMPSLAANPLKSMRGSQSARLEVAGIDYRDKKAKRKVVLPSLAVNLSSVHRKGGAGKANATVVSDLVLLENGPDFYRVEGLKESLSASFDKSPDQGVVNILSTLEVASAKQSAFPEYAVGKLKLVGNVEIDRLRSIFLREIVLDNPAAGTRLRASGALEQTGLIALRKTVSIAGREALTLEGQLTQKLDHMATWELAKEASGSLVIPFRLESGDLLSFRVVAKLIATKVSYTSKDGMLAIKELSGVIPLAEEIALLPDGVVLIPGPRTSPLSATRFFDVHPFLDSDDYLTAKEVVVGGQRIGPLAGNVRLSRSVFSIDQLQLGYRGGQISGQVQAAYREGDPVISARLNITGVRPTGSEEVLDANAAFTFVPRTLSATGKVQIVRISRVHLLEMLDILDPYRETVNINKVRLGLKIGYPKFVRLLLRDGAVNAKVELGGVAKIVRIDEIKAVPLGPIMQKYVAPALSGLLPRQRSQADLQLERESEATDEESDEASDEADEQAGE